MPDDNKSSSLLSTAASIASAVSSPVASILNYFGNKSLNEERNRMAVEQWHRENEYNLPANQVQRLKDAGLNPALMYENGASGLVSASSPEMTSSTANFQGVDPLTAAQIRNLDAQTQSVQDENARQNELQPFNVQNVKANNAVLAQKVKNLSAEEQLTYAQKTFTDSQTEINNNNAIALLESLKADANYKNSVAEFTLEQTKQLVALFELRQQGIELTNEEIRSRIGVNEATAKNLNDSSKLLSSQYDLNVQKYTQSYVEFPYLIQLDKMSARLQKNQARYWYDYTEQPWRYRHKTKSSSESHEFHAGSNGAGGSSSSSFLSSW